MSSAYSTSLLLQVHIKHAGKSRMLFNKFKLEGIAPKVQKLALREGQVSLKTPAEQALPVVRHAKPVNATPAVISDDEEVELHAVSYEEESPPSSKPTTAVTAVREA